MDEEYRFWDYCEGKKGDCLETEQKFFEGYWMPDIDINESLADRLGELTYEPEEVSEPIQEQDGQEDWVVPVRPEDSTPKRRRISNRYQKRRHTIYTIRCKNIKSFSYNV